MAATNKFQGTLGRQNAAHLLRRATFAPTHQNIEQFAELNIDQAMAILFDDSLPLPDPPIDTKTNTTWLSPKSVQPTNSEQEELISFFKAWHLEQMRNSGTNIRERITYFLHTHLPTRETLVQESEGLYYQNALYRYYAFGSYKSLFRKLLVDNAMLIYLDNGINMSNSPNENFAREMFELYSIGRGVQVEEGNYSTYTEADIKAATRVLTGYQTDLSYSTIDPDTNLPTGSLRSIDSADATKKLAVHHTVEAKVFSSIYNNISISPNEIVEGYATAEAVEQELDDLINMIFDKDETALFLTQKIYRHFFYYKTDDPVTDSYIISMAGIFKSSDYDLPTLLKAMLSSNHFFDVEDPVADNNRGAIIKSPIELILGTCNLFDVSFPTALADLYQKTYINGIFEFFEKQGLNFYEPFEVAGYPAYHQFPAYNRNWITPHYLAYRYRFAQSLIAGVNLSSDDLGIQIDILDWVQNSGAISDAYSADVIVDSLLELMVPFSVSTERRAYFLDTQLLDGNMKSAWTDSWTTYQTDGSNETTVRNDLNRLVSAIMESPEYQLY